MRKDLKKLKYYNIQRLKLHVSQRENHTTAIDYANEGERPDKGSSTALINVLDLYLSFLSKTRTRIAHVFPNPTGLTIRPHDTVVLLVVSVESIGM